MSILRRVAGVVLALAAIAGLFAVPGVLARADRDDAPDAAAVFDASFAVLVQAAPGLRLTREGEHEIALPLEGGLSQVGTCRRATAGARGWICVTLNRAGDRAAAAWVTPRPEEPARDLVYSDDDPETLPNP